jgi:hypothetical protein
MNGIGVDENSKQEIQDNLGSSVVYSGTATTTPANVPSSAGNIISGFILRNSGTNDMQISMDGGTTYFTVDKRGNFSWNVKGEITQVQVKTAVSTTTYELLINFEDV